MLNAAILRNLREGAGVKGKRSPRLRTFFQRKKSVGGGQVKRRDEVKWMIYKARER